jgi:hypothetical protein
MLLPPGKKRQKGFAQDSPIVAVALVQGEAEGKRNLPGLDQN